MLGSFKRWALARFPLRQLKDAVKRRATVRRLTAQIRKEFPDLEFKHARLFDEGHDHEVLILDKTWAFRFPRFDDYRENLPYEVRILREIKEKTSANIPDYTLVAKGDAFGGYRLVDGRPLRPEVFRKLDRPTQEIVAREIAEVLRAIHSTPPELLKRPDGSSRYCGEDPRFSDGRFEERKAALLAATSVDLVDKIERFYATPDPAPPRSTLIHSDFQEDHILLAPDGHSIGVIDFSDTAIGDPAWDFGMLWAYGDWVPAYVIKHYGLAEDDASFLLRSRRQSARYWIDRLYWRTQGHDVHKTVAGVAAIVINELRSLESAIHLLGI